MSEDRTAEEWGRIAVGLPGWRWLPGAHDATGRAFVAYDDCGEAAWLWSANDGCEWLTVAGRVPDPDDPATAGCLLALLLGPGVKHVIPTIHQRTGSASVEIDGASNLDTVTVRHLPTLGRACIAAAEALGRWPGGAS